MHFDWDKGRFHYVQPPTNLLERFLAGNNATAFARIAKRYGPLGLFDEGGEPVARPERLQGLTDDPAAKPRGMEGLMAHHRESIAWWRFYQQQFRVTIALGAAFREGRPADLDLLRQLGSVGWISLDMVDQWAEFSDSTRRILTGQAVRMVTMNGVRMCGLRPALVFRQQTSQPMIDLVFQDAAGLLSMGGISLFGVLVVQLLAAVTGTGFFACSACGQVFVPKHRKPAFDRRRYCSKCGRAAALRDAKADYRANLRKKEAARRRTK